jgi:predicted transposase YdaD
MRLRWKLRLVKGLYQRGFKQQDILELFRIIDWLMALPAEPEQQFKLELIAFEEERRMPYITSVERLGMEKGIAQGVEQGIEQGKQEIVINMLREGLELVLIAKLSGLSVEQIQRLQSKDELTRD